MNTSKDTSALTGLPGSVTIARRRAADALRHAGLHRHLDEFDSPVAVPAEGVFDDFVGAGADPAAGDDEVERLAGVSVEQRTELGDIVFGGGDRDHLRAGVAHRCGQHDRVGLVDLSRLQGVPGATSSDPVETTSTRWRGITGSSASPSADASPSIAGVTTWPARRTVVPVTSSPARRMWAPTGRDLRIATVSTPPSVSSTGTTALAPAWQWRAGHDPVRGMG